MRRHLFKRTRLYGWLRKQDLATASWSLALLLGLFSFLALSGLLIALLGYKEKRDFLRYELRGTTARAGAGGTRDL